jgi:Flp pilus assembly protein TadD
MAKNLATLFLIVFLGNGAGYALDSVRIVVFPFEGSTKESVLSWLNEGIAYSIARQLEVRGVVVPDLKELAVLVESLDLPPGAQLSHASMIRAAQRTSANFLILGTYSGTRQNLVISAKTLDVKTMRLSGSMAANGRLSSLPQMENDLAWQILNNSGLGKSLSREKFQLKTRKAPNQAYATFIESFGASNESSRIQLLVKAVDLYRDFQEAHVELASIYFQKENCSKAMPHLNFGQNEGDDDPDREFMRGTCYLQEGLQAKAIQSLSSVTSRSFEVLNNLGIAYLRNDKYRLASTALLEARRLAHSDSTVALNMAILRHLQRFNIAARNIVEEALKSHPRDGMLQFLMGFLLQAQGEKEKAASAFSNASSFGVNVETLQAEAPKTWTKAIFEIQSAKASR